MLKQAKVIIHYALLLSDGHVHVLLAYLEKNTCCSGTKSSSDVTPNDALMDYGVIAAQLISRSLS